MKVQDVDIGPLGPETHGQKRIGLLTSSVATTILHGKEASWASLRNALWADDGSAFASATGEDARAYGHAHEAEGAAKFWEQHPEFELIQHDAMGNPPFFTYRVPGPLFQWLGSSPDRIVAIGPPIPMAVIEIAGGLEVKSPTTPEKFAEHTLRKHYDQCQHGLLVTGLPTWWLAIHHGELYKEFQLLPDIEWQARYLQRATAFLAFCYEDKPVKRRKLSINDL